MEIGQNTEFKSSFPSDYLSNFSLEKEKQLHQLSVSALFKEFEKVVPDIRKQLLISGRAKIWISHTVEPRYIAI